MIIAPINYNESATILDKSEAAVGLPEANILTDQPSELWRTTTNGDQYVEIDLGSAKDYNFVGVLYSNCDSSATCRFRAADTQLNLTAAPGHDTGAVTMMHRNDLADFFNRFHSLIYFSSTATKTYRFARFDFASLSGLSYLDVGNIVISNAVTLIPRHGFTSEVRDFAGQIDTKGSMFGITGKRRRVLGFEISGKTDVQMWDSLIKLDLTIDAHRPMFYSIDPNNANYEMQWSVLGYKTGGKYTRVFTGITDRSNYQVHEIELP